ncbi:MAG: 3-deoxy-7-phosphoheptulonate synthase, partial [Polyangiaceae bacterium]|nr:3-deoxy-7-phosphoheptulonate synthase [Polyangiaceae bacterium]
PPHHFLSGTKQGLAGIVSTRGNQNCHVILRGGKSGPNYESEHVEGALALLQKAGIQRGVMVDLSHANSNKNHENQPKVASDLAKQIAGGNRGLVGVMIESNITAGRQNAAPGKPLTYGQSITDACLGFEETVPVLEELAESIKARRGIPSNKNID